MSFLRVTLKKAGVLAGSCRSFYHGICNVVTICHYRYYSHSRIIQSSWTIVNNKVSMYMRHVLCVKWPRFPSYQDDHSQKSKGCLTTLPVPCSQIFPLHPLQRMVKRGKNRSFIRSRSLFQGIPLSLNLFQAAWAGFIGFILVGDLVELCPLHEVPAKLRAISRVLQRITVP